MPQVPKSAINQILEGNPNKKNTEELKERAEQENNYKIYLTKITLQNS